MNALELAIEEGKSAVDFYLSDVSIDQFIQDIQEIKKKYANKGAIEEAINTLKKML